jgi:hypothetical protein
MVHGTIEIETILRGKSMARKRSSKNQSKQKAMMNFDATVRKINSVLLDPRWHATTWRGVSGVREKLLSIDFEVLRNVVQKVPIINAIINTRIDQILPFCRYTEDESKPGYRFELSAGESGDILDSEIKQLALFIDQTGFNEDAGREDDFADWLQMFIRDTYEIDQVATEIQYNRVGEAVAFWALDGATIKRTDETNEFGVRVAYVQEIEQQIYNKFTTDTMLFDYKNKRSDIRYRGYGYSYVEQCIDVITTLLFGYKYVQDQLVKDKVPKGFISVMGDVGSEQLDGIRSYWYSAMSGAGGQWNIPILPSGKDGVGIDFKTLSDSNKDMEYHKTMMFISSIVGAVFGMDLAEMGMKSDDSQALIGESTAPRLQYSKNRGLNSALAYAQQHINKIMRKVTTKYKLKFVGMEPEDEQKKAEIDTKNVQSKMSVDELRERDGLEPFNEDWSKIVLNPQAIQIFLASKQQQQQAGDEFGGYDDYNEGGDQQDDQDSTDDNTDDMQKSISAFHRRTLQKGSVKITIE